MAKNLKIVVATNNEHKLKELREIFEPYNVALLSLKDVGIEIDPDETGSTYEETAFIKANAVSKFTNLPVLSDDSGIEISELGEHFPGIFSSRYAKANGGQEKINDFLASNHQHSKAYFICHITLLNIDGKSRNDFEGVLEGEINDKVEGSHGFGYDPIFYYPEFKTTLANVSEEKKNSVSHRGVALEKFLKDWSK